MRASCSPSGLNRRPLPPSARRAPPRFHRERPSHRRRARPNGLHPRRCRLRRSLVPICDAILISRSLFAGGAPQPPCEAAADANADGAVDLSDIVYLVNFDFLGGPFRPPPFPQCGADPSPSLPCATPTDCSVPPTPPAGSFETFVGSGVAPLVGVATIPITLDNTANADGWAFDVCHSFGDLTPLGATEGPAVAALNGGAGPDSGLLEVDPLAEFVRAVMIASFIATDTLPPGSGHLLYNVDYQLDAASGSVFLCDAIGISSSHIASDSTCAFPMSTTGTVSLDLGSPPANDDCTAAGAITLGATTFQLALATTDGPDLTGFCLEFGGNVHNDVWYCYAPTCSGPCFLSTTSRGIDTRLAVYSGCAAKRETVPFRL